MRLFKIENIWMGLVLLAIICVTNVPASAQCTITLPSGSWTGATQLGAGGLHETNSAVSINSLGNNQFEVSDFSAGLIDHFGFSASNPVTIEIDCNNQVLSTSKTTDFGTCNITGGSWDAANATLTLEWSIVENRITEKSVFTLN